MSTLGGSSDDEIAGRLFADAIGFVFLVIAEGLDVDHDVVDQRDGGADGVLHLGGYAMALVNTETAIDFDVEIDGIEMGQFAHADAVRVAGAFHGETASKSACTIQDRRRRRAVPFGLRGGSARH